MVTDSFFGRFQLFYFLARKSGSPGPAGRKHLGPCWPPIFTVTDSHTGFALYCRILTLMATTWFMHEYLQYFHIVKEHFCPG